ncbi:MAG: DNA-3-methyladenine glycosylase [Bacteroidota bacterium]|nr:DNA-3-methyladenine glycosylase [Bacteroidota bacterium]
MNTKLTEKFFSRDVLDVAPDLIANVIVRKFDDGTIKKYRIAEVEAYRGEEDLACHASKGRTPRTDVMYNKGGCIYVYLIYGMHWMLNIVCGDSENPQAVLIRCVEQYNGPGKLTKELQIDKSFNRENLETSDRIWIESNTEIKNKRIKKEKRVGIDYSGKVWKNKLWRFILDV